MYVEDNLEAPKKHKQHKLSWEQTSSKEWEKRQDKRFKEQRKACRDAKRNTGK